MNAAYVVAARRAGAVAVPAAAVPVALYAVALAMRMVALVTVQFPLNEGSAYYVAVARSIAAGRGLVVDTIWSYATPPLTLPRPAFELWQPLASVVAAWPMTLFGPSFASAQLGFAVVGALLAPLAWLVARDATRRLDVPEHRRHYVALGAGVLVAVAGPFVLAAAIPDSTLPFTVLVAAAALTLRGAINGERVHIVALGVLLGLAYLTRMEAVYFGIVFVAFAWQAGVRRKELTLRVGAVALIAGVVALPWLLRNLAVFGSPMTGQLADNAFLTTNYQIFDYAGRPSLANFLGQGPFTIAANIAAAVWHQAVDVLLVPGNFVVVAALITVVVGWRRRSALTASPLSALLVFGAVVFAVAALVFPVATLWGTFEHASGPLMVAFAVVAVLGTDAFVARVRQWRNWPRPNAGMAPAALIAGAVAMTALQLAIAGTQATQRQRQMSAVADTLAATGITQPSAPIVTDRPLWLNAATGAPTLVVPRQSAAVMADVAQRFGARYIVLVDGAPAADMAACFESVPLAPNAAAPDLSTLRVTGPCQ